MNDKIQIEKIEAKITEIEKRNSRVELDKAWETSLARKILVSSVTYVLIGVYMLWLGVKSPWLNALIPTVGFILSTLTLAKIKDLWLKKQGKIVDEH